MATKYRSRCVANNCIQLCAKADTLVVGRLRVEGVQRIWLVAPAASDRRAFGFYRALRWRPSGERREGDSEVMEYPPEEYSYNLKAALVAAFVFLAAAQTLMSLIAALFFGADKPQGADA
jgi:hypothetical protein